MTLDAVSSAICLGDVTERNVQNLRLSYHGVFLGDALDALMEADVGRFEVEIPTPASWPSLSLSTEGADGITYSSILSAFQDALCPRDTCIVEVGTISGLMSNIRLPTDAKMISQTLWGSIGAATPMVLGAELAKRADESASDTSDLSRTLLVTGDGAHLMTANEIGTFGRVGAKPIIVVINNGVYGVEEFLERNERRSYNDLTGWKYAEAAKAMLGKGGDGWLIEVVETNAALVDALARARDENKAAYIEARMSEILLKAMSTADLSIMYFDLPPTMTE